MTDGAKLIVLMIKIIINKAKYLFLNGEKRSVLAIRNIFQTFLIRLISIPISFILIPLTINYVDTDSYGVWITISSIVAWMSFFDIGINNGLRNKLTESIAKGDILMCKKYVSTTYAILSIISTIIFGSFIFINLFIDWPILLNTSAKLSTELSSVALIVVGYFSIKFILSTINTILLSYQLPAQASFRGLIEQASSLIIVFLLTKFTHGSLLNLSLGLCLTPLLVLIFFNITMFSGKFKNISPSFLFVDFAITKDLMGIGFKFFIIQIAGIIQFQTANFIIIQTLGPKEVTLYNIVFKYFSILTMLMSILMTPIWSAVTDAYVKNDYDWIIRIEKKFRKISIGLFLVGLLMLFLAQNMFDLWLGKGKISVPFITSFFMFLYTSISLFGSIYCAILNGISALNIQYKASLISPFIFIISSYFIIHFFNWGVNAIIIASIIANFNGYILAPLQFRNIFYVKRTI